MQHLWTGSLTKMKAEHTTPVSYTLVDGFHDQEQRSEPLSVNPFIGGQLEIRYSGEMRCVACGRKSKKPFGPGYCFPCFRSRPEADICIVKPEKCHFFETDNPCRDEEFAHTNCFQPHVLYVSVTSGVKVGITRQVNVPSRWIDQGAVQAMPIAVMPNRREVGLVEHELAQTFADKTHWATMLKNQKPEVDLPGTVESVLARLKEMGVDGVLELSDRGTYEFEYPVNQSHEKVKSLNLEKTPTVGGTLWGIKGQYLIFDTGVINIRKYTGYRVEIWGQPA